MGRWKSSPQGSYWDPNDSGPNQVDPLPGHDPNTGQSLGAAAPQRGMQQAPPLAPSAGENTGIVPPQMGTPNPNLEHRNTLPFQREQFRDAWQGSGITNVAGLNQFLAQYGIGPAQGNGVVTLPNGEQIDMLQAARTGNGTPSWGGVGGGGGGGGLSPQTFGASGGAGASGGGTGVEQSLRDTLLQLMQRSQPGAIDPTTDANLAPQSAAYRRSRERQGAQQRAQAAERAAQQGLNLGGQGSGAFESNIGGIAESVGEDIAGYDAGLVGQEMQARRQDLLSALQIANSIGARDQAAQLQMQIAQMDQAIRQQQIGLGHAQLGFQQSQWDDQYGLSQQQMINDQNRIALLLALGG